ncbi:hypothetical protein E3N88_06820 [Mikania micrantha]|uniref:Uncharacterized protein n=1 Tax=Mikania micrantha TaxID=192012 RepID=A0A5N6PPR1_9ASTR|nr:hypothetical protein E3N88_06820 [Mikania micrantha]
MVNPRDRYIYRQIPYVILDDTPSPSSSSDSDPSEASSAASLVVSDDDTSADHQARSPSPQRVPVYTWIRRMGGQACKTIGLPPRHQLALRDIPGSTHEVGESSRQAEMRAQLQQVTLDLQSTRLELRQSYGSL